jgi:hypothetical protein
MTRKSSCGYAARQERIAIDVLLTLQQVDRIIDMIKQHPTQILNWNPKDKAPSDGNINHKSKHLKCIETLLKSALGFISEYVTQDRMDELARSYG